MAATPLTGLDEMLSCQVATWAVPATSARWRGPCKPRPRAANQKSKPRVGNFLDFDLSACLQLHVVYHAHRGLGAWHLWSRRILYRDHRSVAKKKNACRTPHGCIVGAVQISKRDRIDPPLVTRWTARPRGRQNRQANNLVDPPLIIHWTARTRGRRNAPTNRSTVPSSRYAHIMDRNNKVLEPVTASAERHL